MAIYVAPISSGLGDLIVSLPAIHGFIAQGEETHLVVRSHRQRDIAKRITGLAGEIEESELPEKSLKDGERFVDLRDHPLQRDFIWGSQEFNARFGPLKIMQIVELLCNDLAVPADFSTLTPLAHTHRPGLNETVLLIPGTDGFRKHWPLEHWLLLNRSLLSEGLKTLVVGQPSQSPAVARLLEYGVPWERTATIGDAIDVISSSKAAVAVDTGLMHIAVHQGKPTVALMRADGLYTRLEKNCRTPATTPCTDDCIREFALDKSICRVSLAGLENRMDTRPCQSPEQSCMARISPQDVLRAFYELDVAVCHA